MFKFESTRVVVSVKSVLPLVCVLLLSVASVADAAKLALFIGNNNYQNVTKLSNAAKDAKLLYRAVSSLGFSGSLVIDAGKNDIKREMENLGARIKKGDIVFVYYAGHGVQFAGENYLLPVDAKIDTPEDLPNSAVSFTQLFDMLDKGGISTSLIVLDACRNNPFEQIYHLAQARSLKITKKADGVERKIDYTAKGLVQPARVPSNSLIAFATAPGKVASDGALNSPFAAALAKAIVSEGQEITSVFRDASLEVKNVTDFEQEPWVNWSLNGPLTLKPRRADVVSPF